MANWCINYVDFSGERTQEFLDLMQTLVEKEKETGEGQVPKFIKADDIDGYFFELEVTDTGLIYHTKWASNSNVLRFCAEHFGLDYHHEYEEPGNVVYGRYSYENGTLYHKCIECGEDTWEETEDFDGYVYNGETYECVTDITDQILDKKEWQIVHTKNTDNVKD